MGQALENVISNGEEKIFSLDPKEIAMFETLKKFVSTIQNFFCEFELKMFFSVRAVGGTQDGAISN